MQPRAAETPHTPLSASVLALAQSVSDGVAICSDGRIVWASSRLAQLAGVASAGNLEGQPLESLFDATSGSAANGDSGIRMLGGVQARLWRANSDGGGEEIWVIGTADPQGALEEELRHARRELAEFQCETASLQARLQRELDEREELLTVVSHELRTPVTVISGYNRLLLSDQVGSLSPEQRRFLKESSKSCQRLDDFIGNLLKSSRAGSGENHFNLQPTSLQKTVDDVVKFLRPLLEQHELRVEVALDSNALLALFDASPIEQVLTNLLGNAIKYTKPGSAVVVESRRVEDEGDSMIEVSVLDEGPGIALEDQKRIFDPYVRATDEMRASGLGLGLAICRRIVEAHRGGIAVTNREVGGSRFSFTLPAANLSEVEI